MASSFKPCGDFFDLLFLVEDERCPVVRVVPDYGPSSGDVALIGAHGDHLERV